MNVTAAQVVELSATDAPARPGSTFTIEPPAIVPEPERFALDTSGRFRLRFPTG